MSCSQNKHCKPCKHVVVTQMYQWTGDKNGRLRPPEANSSVNIMFVDVDDTNAYLYDILFIRVDYNVNKGKSSRNGRTIQVSESF